MAVVSQVGRGNTSGLVGLWNSRVVIAPVLGPLGITTPPELQVKAVKFRQDEGAPASPSEKGKKSSSFSKFRQLENQQILQGNNNRFGRPATSAPPPIHNSPPSTPTTKIVSRSASSAKEMLLIWVQQKINHYDNVKVTNFSTCWNDGLAFCALIHCFYPEAFDFTSLESKNRKYNFTLAFNSAEEYGGIYPLLDVEDMVKMKTPDWKCVFTYVQSFYRRFRDGRDRPTPTRTLVLDPSVRDTPTRSLVLEMDNLTPPSSPSNSSSLSGSMRLRRQCTLPVSFPSPPTTPI